MNEFFIEDKIGYQDYNYLEDLINFSLDKLKLENTTFSIILTGDEEIRELNRDYRNIDKVTDVISFALNDNIDIKMPINALGDIFISIPQMQRQAKEYNHIAKRELSFLVVHGLLHLLGYDHQNEEEETLMINLQKEILNEKEIRK